ncbi:glycosyltransferase family 2 protein [Carnimonas bestiolae]|uniref:glycosyltransferase family 2 protein n=1 Tax=Carnimonas bestiolae TaxID=3402172 RepID=UPI003EDC2383
MKFAIAAIVKNEVDSIEEWVAYHRLLGADHFLIADNGSTDGTREYLLSLSGLEWMTVIDFVTSRENPPQLLAYSKLISECPTSVPLLTFIDADEYILPMPEDDYRDASLRRQMDVWVNARFSNPGVSAVAMNWATFGSSGHKFKTDELVIERFQKRSTTKFLPNKHYKAIVRREHLERMESPHQPLLSQGKMVNALGRTCDYYVSPSLGARKGLSEKLIWRGARINHYIVKSVEEFVSKKSPRGSATQLGREKKAEYFETFDKNDVTDDRLAGYADEVKKEMQKLALHRQLALKLRNIDVSQGLGQKLEKALFRRKKADLSSLLREFHLDYPEQQAMARMQDGQVVVQGWLLLADEFAEFHEHAKVVIRLTSKCELTLPLNIERPDVIKHFALDTAENNQLLCGFRVLLSPSVEHFSLTLELDGFRWHLEDVKVNTDQKAPDPAQQVLIGDNDFLYLKADANHGLYQHSGQLLLTPTGLDAWQQYLDAVGKAASKLDAAYRVMVVPSKEAVLDGYIPVSAGGFTPADQIVHLSPNVSYPIEALKSLGDGAYFRTDTHWTHEGALSALLGVLADAGRDITVLESLFQNDVYKIHDYVGDLGNKLSPPVSRPVRVLSSFKYRDLIVYDNGLSNHGRIVVMENEEALWDETLLIFGASSSTMLFFFVSRIFSRVVFAHTTGHWDNDFARHVSPDLVLLQTNARFVTVPPHADFSIKKTIKQKVSGAGTSTQQFLDARVVKERQPERSACWDQWDKWLLDSIGSNGSDGSSAVE